MLLMGFPLHRMDVSCVSSQVMVIGLRTLFARSLALWRETPCISAASPLRSLRASRCFETGS